MKILESIANWALVIVMLTAGIVYLNGYFTPIKVGSIETGQEYTATTTADIRIGAASDKTFKRGWGSLGSITITKAGDAVFRLYDATSTQAINQSNFNSSTSILVDFPTNAAAGTYVFDVNFNYGLVLDIVSGSTGTSTISFR